METSKKNAAAETGEEIVETTAIPSAAADDDGNDMILKFKKPYHFEGETYTEVDLSGMEDATGADLITVTRLAKKAGGGADPLIEMSAEMACHMAARMTSHPVEFFMNLPVREAMKLKNLVTGFLFGGED